MSSQQITERPPTVSKVCLMVIVWAGVLLATIAVGVRAYMRIRYRGRFQLDDIFTAFALALLIASAIMYSIACNPLFTLALVGSGEQYPPPDDFEETTELYLRLQFAITLSFWTCLWTVKASFLTLFYPLSNGLKSDRILWYCVVTFVSIGYVASVISYPVSCSTFTLGSCDSDTNVQLSLVSLRMSTALDVISDAFIILLPWKIIWIVQLSRKEKIAVSAIVGLGVVVMIFAIIRIIVTNTIHTHPEPVWLALWSSLETTVSVIVISLTSLKVLFNKRNANSSGYGSRGRAGYGSRITGGDKANSTMGAIPLTQTGNSAGLQPYTGDMKNSTSNESQEILVYD